MVKGFRWVGVGASDISEMEQFCTNTLGLSVLKRGAKASFVECARQWQELGRASQYAQAHRIDR